MPSQRASACSGIFTQECNPKAFNAFKKVVAKLTARPIDQGFFFILYKKKLKKPHIPHIRRQQRPPIDHIIRKWGNAPWITLFGRSMTERDARALMRSKAHTVSGNGCPIPPP